MNIIIWFTANILLKHPEAKRFHSVWFNPVPFITQNLMNCYQGRLLIFFTQFPRRICHGKRGGMYNICPFYMLLHIFFARKRMSKKNFPVVIINFSSISFMSAVDSAGSACYYPDFISCRGHSLRIILKKYFNTANMRRIMSYNIANFHKQNSFIYKQNRSAVTTTSHKILHILL